MIICTKILGPPPSRLSGRQTDGRKPKMKYFLKFPSVCIWSAKAFEEGIAFFLPLGSGLIKALGNRKSLGNSVAFVFSPAKKCRPWWYTVQRSRPCEDLHTWPIRWKKPNSLVQAFKFCLRVKSFLCLGILLDSVVLLDAQIFLLLVYSGLNLVC